MFRLCSDRLSLECIPRKTLKLNLSNYERSGELTLMVKTPYFLVFKFKDGPEVTIRKDGRMIIRKVTDEELAQKIAVRALAIGSDDAT